MISPHASWQEDPANFAVTYPIDIVIDRANFRIKSGDRNIEMGSDLWGGRYQALINRLFEFNRLKQSGVTSIKVFYDPNYYLRYRSNIHILDPLHMQYVLKYGI